MKLRKLQFRFLQMLLLVIVLVSLSSSFFVFCGKASPPSTYYYRFTVDEDGFTNVEINFYSTDTQTRESWVFVPKNSSWGSPDVTKGHIIQAEVVETEEVAGQSHYFYQAFRFSYQADGFFNMTIRYGFNNGALIIEPRGIFYSPQIGFKSNSDGRAQVFFDNSFNIDTSRVTAVGLSGNYPAQEVQLHPPRILFNLFENIVRLQVEFSIPSTTPQLTSLKSSDNKTFTFKTMTRYKDYAQNVRQLYDRIYSNFTRLFNVTLSSVEVQFFLPDFETLLTVGGFIPFTSDQLGEININIVFIRAVNGTIELIAAHELVHHFLSKAGVSPGDFLWFHEGMAEYVSVITVERLNYEGATQEKNTLEQGVSRLVRQLGGEKFSFLQNWNPSSSPANVADYYVASYYIVKRLSQDYGGFDFYQRFFELIHGIDVPNIDILTLYLSKAANAELALPLQEWGFSVSFLYTSPETAERIVETQKALSAVNPVFQPYKFLAEFFYQQALRSLKRGDTETSVNLLQLATVIANLAPLLTLLTITALIGIIAYVLYRRSEKARLKPIVPPPPPEIFSNKSTKVNLKVGQLLLSLNINPAINSIIPTKPNCPEISAYG